ncbi:hypothetical protein AOLI_G00253430 [Acnodon oligacanthus]
MLTLHYRQLNAGSECFALCRLRWRAVVNSELRVHKPADGSEKRCLCAAVTEKTPKPTHSPVQCRVMRRR